MKSVFSHKNKPQANQPISSLSETGDTFFQPKTSMISDSAAKEEDPAAATMSAAAPAEEEKAAG